MKRWKIKMKNEYEPLCPYTSLFLKYLKLNKWKVELINQTPKKTQQYVQEKR